MNWHSKLPTRYPWSYITWFLLGVPHRRMFTFYNFPPIHWDLMPEDVLLRLEKDGVAQSSRIVASSVTGSNTSVRRSVPLSWGTVNWCGECRCKWMHRPWAVNIQVLVFFDGLQRHQMAEGEELNIDIRFCCTYKDSLPLRHQPIEVTKYFQKTFRDDCTNTTQASERYSRIKMAKLRLKIWSSGPPSSSRIDYSYTRWETSNG